MNSIASMIKGERGMKPDEALFQENRELKAEIERLKDLVTTLQKRCRDIALCIAAELKNCGIDTEGSLAAQRIAREIMGENDSDA